MMKPWTIEVFLCMKDHTNLFFSLTSNQVTIHLDKPVLLICMVALVHSVWCSAANTDYAEAAKCDWLAVCLDICRLHETYRRENTMIVLGTPAMLRGLPLATINAMGTVIPDSRQVKTLGVNTDSYMKFKTHIDHLTAICTGILMGLMHAKHVTPYMSLPTVVQSLVYSVTRYCMSVL